MPRATPTRHTRVLRAQLAYTGILDGCRCCLPSMMGGVGLLGFSLKSRWKLALPVSKSPYYIVRVDVVRSTCTASYATAVWHVPPVDRYSYVQFCVYFTHERRSKFFPCRRIYRYVTLVYS